MYLLGFDIGSSSIKVSVVDENTGQPVVSTHSPKVEMAIISHQMGWAEQDPLEWWKHMRLALAEALESEPRIRNNIKAIGISYQMHGLVLLDEEKQLLRPSIIWCDSRAVPYGAAASDALGKEYCLEHYLNVPGNFTAAKLKWVKEHEPDLFDRVKHSLLPGDYINYLLTGALNTTISALSEGIFWDFKQSGIAKALLDNFGFSEALVPTVVDCIGHHGKTTPEAASYLGISAGIPVTYRAGDQPNNAMSLNVLSPGEIAATGGTSGVVYAVTDKMNYDHEEKVNIFAHVNHKNDDPRLGILLCINGSGILYSWIKKNASAQGKSYFDLEQAASQISIGSEGLRIIPFGNGAERMLNNQNPGAQIQNLHFNTHHQGHLYRATLEGIAFSFVMGIEHMKSLGVAISSIKVGNDNLFQSNIFSSTIANLIDAQINVVNTTGAIGAARAAGCAVGSFGSLREAMGLSAVISSYEPSGEKSELMPIYQDWKNSLSKLLDQ